MSTTGSDGVVFSYCPMTFTLAFMMGNPHCQKDSHLARPSGTLRCYWFSLFERVASARSKKKPNESCRLRRGGESFSGLENEPLTALPRLAPGQRRLDLGQGRWHFCTAKVSIMQRACFEAPCQAGAQGSLTGSTPPWLQACKHQQGAIAEKAAGTAEWATPPQQMMQSTAQCPLVPSRWAERMNHLRSRGHCTETLQ